MLFFVVNMYFCKRRGEWCDVRVTYIKHPINHLITVNKIVTIHYYEFDKNFKFHGERHNFWEMVYLDKGQVEITANGEKHTLSAGEVIFHQPNEFHTICADDRVAPNVFVISFVSSSQSMSFFEGKKTRLPAPLKRLISLIIEEGQKTYHLPLNDPNLRELVLRDDAPLGGSQLIKIYLEQLLISLIRAEAYGNRPAIFASKSHMEDHLVSQVNALLEKHLYGKITVAEICETLNYSRTYLSRIFKSATGQTIASCYGQMKINRAKELIREKNQNFTEISELLAFDNALYFSRVFKRITGMSPREYANSVRVD